MGEARHARAAPLVNRPAFHLIYRSHTTLEPSAHRQELGLILRKARARNPARGVTGALLLYNGWFAQLLEGPEPMVLQLYHRVKADPRHDAIQVEVAQRVNMRAFPRSAMANISMPGDGAPLGPALAGCTWKTGTPVQDELLVVLHDLARTGGKGA